MMIKQLKINQDNPPYTRHCYIILIICLMCTAFNLSPVQAGEYHNPKERTANKITDTLACAQCHTMHGSQGGQSMVYSGALPQLKLLRHTSVLNLCLFCHDGNQAGSQIESGRVPPDIWGPTQNVTNGPSGGNLCYNGTEPASPPCLDGSTNHTVGRANVTPPGSNPPITLALFTCVNCHNPHGSINYRNLRNANYEGAQFDNVNVWYKFDNSNFYTADVTDINFFVKNWGVGLNKYQTSNVKFRKAPTSNTDGIPGFCRACHTKFHGMNGDPNMGGSSLGDTSSVGDEWKRHPSADVSIGEGQTNMHVAEQSVWSGRTWYPRMIDLDGSPGTGDEIPFCLSCHRAHGSTRHSNLIYGDPLGGVGGSGTMIRETCQQCHNQ